VLTLLLALVFAEPPYQRRPFPIVLTLTALHGDVAARRGRRMVGAECSQLTASVYDGVSVTGPIAAVADETASVDRADHRLGDGDRPALAA
jgi:hypothetical protein